MKLLLLLAALAAAAPLDSTLAQVDALVREQDNKPADEVRALDKKIAALKGDFRKAGPQAAAPLAALARDAAKPLKERIWAVNFLALLSDPAAFEPLSSLALAEDQPEVVRAQALSALASTGVSDAALRRPACAALAKKNLPPEALREALRLASRTGCDEPALLSRRAKDQGSRPMGNSAPLLAGLTIRGLARSHPPAAAQELLDLLSFFKKGAPERALTLTALQDQVENLKADRGLAVSRICEVLVEEGQTPPNALAALHLLVALDGRACEPALLRELNNADAEIVAEDAETLAALKLESAIAPLSRILDGVISDPRFAPRPGRPDPVGLIDRIQRALIRLR